MLYVSVPSFSIYHNQKSKSMELLMSTDSMQLKGNVQGNRNESSTLLLRIGCFNQAIGATANATLIVKYIYQIH